MTGMVFTLCNTVVVHVKLMVWSFIFADIPTDVNLNKLFVLIYWFMNQKESTSTIPFETLDSFCDKQIIHHQQV